MAIAQSLRYYRGQFNPESIYDAQNRNSDVAIYSMYNPEAEQAFIEAVGKRQERFDTTNLAYAAEKARIGEMETYNLAGLTKQLSNFENKIKETVRDKYNGDWGAAANEVARMIGTERSNPFYHYNKQQVEMGKAYLNSKMQLGSNFMSVGNPFNVSFEDWQRGKSLEFTPVNREEIVKQAATEFSSLANLILRDPTLQSTAGGQYLLSTVQTGIADPTELMKYLETDEGQVMIDNIKANNPILDSLPQDEVMDAIVEGAHSAIGKTTIDYMPNQDYISNSDKASANGTGSAGSNLIYNKGYIDVDKNLEKMLGTSPDGKPIALEIFALQEITPSMLNQKGINEIKARRDWVNEFAQKLVTGPKVNPGIEYASKKDRKAAEEMTDNVSITGFGFNPGKPDIVLSLRGTDKDKNTSESTVILHTKEGGVPRPEFIQLLNGYYTLANPEDPNSEFVTTANEWYRKFFPEYIK